MDFKKIIKNVNDYLKKNLSFIMGIIGAFLLLFMSWHKNIGLLVWISFPMLVFAFRKTIKWYYLTIISVLIVIIKFFSIHGGWSMSIVTELGFSLVISTPILIALLLDKILHNKLKSFIATLIFPIIYISFDFFISLTPLGMVFGVVNTQFAFIELIQGASLFGSWFIGFLIVWFASVCVTLFQNLRTFNAVRVPTITFIVIFISIVIFGAFRTTFNRSTFSNVTIASITVEHEMDYWEITDRGTIPSESISYKPSMIVIENELFRLSQNSADYGAKIIFWSEGNCVMYEDDFEEFKLRAQNFAIVNEVYFMPAVLVLEYEKESNKNMCLMISPQGEIEFIYEKTYSWYPSTSDGVIKTVDTPYGTLAAAICFDMDFPNFIRQAKDADIMLVPAYDTAFISPYHTENALIRGIEFGFSVVRQDNAGISMASDFNGNILASQNFFTTEIRCMISDIPINGQWTFYGFTGEWFVYLNLVAAIFVYSLVIFKKLIYKFKLQKPVIFNTK